jgi:hypothetical protein
MILDVFPDPDIDFLPIPDPRYRGLAPDPGSVFATLVVLLVHTTELSEDVNLPTCVVKMST